MESPSVARGLKAEQDELTTLSANCERVGVEQPAAASGETLCSAHGSRDEHPQLLSQSANLDLSLAPRTTVISGKSPTTSTSEVLTSQRQNVRPGRISPSSAHLQDHGMQVDACPSKSARTSKHAGNARDGQRDTTQAGGDSQDRMGSGQAGGLGAQHESSSAPTVSSSAGNRAKEDSELTADDFRPTNDRPTKIRSTMKSDFHPIPSRSQGGTSSGMGMFSRAMFNVPGGAPTMMPRSCNPQLAHPQPGPQGMHTSVPMNLGGMAQAPQSYAGQVIPPMTVQHAAQMILDDANSRSQGMIESARGAAQQMARGIIVEANQRYQDIIADARKEGDEIVDEAKRTAHAICLAANKQAVMLGLGSQIDDLSTGPGAVPFGTQRFGTANMRQRGQVFASLVDTSMLLPPQDQSAQRIGSDHMQSMQATKSFLPQ